MIVKEGPFSASDMDGAADYILDRACRIWPFGVRQEGVACDVVRAGTLAANTEVVKLLFGKTLHRPIRSRRCAIES